MILAHQIPDSGFGVLSVLLYLCLGSVEH